MPIDTPNVSIPTDEDDTNKKTDSKAENSGAETDKVPTNSECKAPPKDAVNADETKDETKGGDEKCAKKAGSVEDDEHAACPPTPTNSEATTGNDLVCSLTY